MIKEEKLRKLMKQQEINEIRRVILKNAADAKEIEKRIVQEKAEIVKKSEEINIQFVAIVAV